MSTPKRPVIHVNTAQIIKDMFDRGWNQTDLSKASGVHTATLSRFLCGEHQTPRTLTQIAAALGRTASDYTEISSAA